MPVDLREPEIETALDEGIGLCLDPLASRGDLVRWLTQYPELAAELADGLAASAHIERLIAPLRAQSTDREPMTIAYSENSTASPPSTSLEFGDFEILDELGRGGMGIVYKARQKSLDRIVALKTTLAGNFPSAHDVARLRFEAEAAARLDHPNIVPIYGAGEYQGMPFFSMKHVPGGTLAMHLAKCRGNLPTAASLLAKVARAVHYAHQRGILHRDLKPGNIIFDTDGEPVVADFGLAKAVDAQSMSSGSGAIVGTASYMPPEQARGDRGPTTSVDVYSLGAIVYELLTGIPPFRAETTYETLRQVIEQAPQSPRKLNPNAPPDLEAICLKCLEKKPEDRYASAEALAIDLERFSRGESIVRPTTVLSHMFRALRSRRPISEPASENWHSIVLRSSSVVAICHVTLFALMLSESTMLWVWIVLAGYFGFIGYQRIRQAQRSRSYTPWERHTIIVWMGHLVASIGLAIVILPFDRSAPADRVLALYPPLAVLYVLACFVQGSTSFGLYFLASLVYLLLAIVFRFCGIASPLVFVGVHVPFTIFLTGLSVRRPRSTAQLQELGVT